MSPERAAAHEKPLLWPEEQQRVAGALVVGFLNSDFSILI
jgi:hypothetical protein